MMATHVCTDVMFRQIQFGPYRVDGGIRLNRAIKVRLLHKYRAKPMDVLVVSYLWCIMREECIRMIQ